MQRRRFIFLSLLPLALAAAQASAAYPEYRVTIVGPVNSQGVDINSSGTVIGTYAIGSDRTGSFINRGSGVVKLGTLGGLSSQVAAINDKGEIVGNRVTASGERRGFIYYHGKARDLVSSPNVSLTYVDINNAGYTVGLGAADSTGGLRSYLRAPDGRLRDLGALPGVNPVTAAEALNNRNQVTGESGPFLPPDPPLRAFLWTKGTMRDLGDFGATPNFGLAINDRGQVTGYAEVGPGPHNQVAFLYSHGRLIDIDGRPPSADRFSEGDGINNLGQVVGYSNHLGGFIYRGRHMESLNALVDPKLGLNILYANAINDKGQIAATAVRAGATYAVRLDLIRPSLQAPPPLDDDAEAGPLLGAATTPEDAAAEADARAHEVVQPAAQ